MATVVEATALTRTYPMPGGVLEALRGIDLEVRSGEFLVLAGPSGCGKTTLISIIAGMLQRSSGHLAVLGRDFARLSDQEMADFRRTHVGMLFQDLHLFPSLTAAQNAALPLIAAGHDRKVACRKAAVLLEVLGLAERGDALAGSLSGGERQRVALARAVVHEPPLLVCDEPTSALDRNSGLGLMALLRKVTVDRGHTAIVVTHDPRLFGFADRVVFMEDGRISRMESAEGVHGNGDKNSRFARSGVIRGDDGTRDGPPAWIARSS